jgi:hypothetical protein
MNFNLIFLPVGFLMILYGTPYISSIEDFYTGLAFVLGGIVVSFISIFNSWE